MPCGQPAAGARGWVSLWGCGLRWQVGMVGEGGRGHGYVAVETEEESFAVEGRRRS